MTDKVTPEVLWAQRSSASDAEKNFVYLTISVPDLPNENMKLDLKPTGLSFEGHSDSLKRSYQLEVEFFAEIDVAASKIHNTGKNVELKLQKKELKEEYWPRLLKDAKKVHFLKTDFEKWVDEDEQEEVGEDNFDMGGMGGMPGMGGMGGNDFGGLDFSKLGGMPGINDEGSDDGDDDMPELEEDETEGEAPKISEVKDDAPKIEEVEDDAPKVEEVKDDAPKA